jgi:hypothetical protein
MGIEPTTSSLGSWHSTAELPPLGEKLATKLRRFNCGNKSLATAQYNTKRHALDAELPGLDISSDGLLFPGFQTNKQTPAERFTPHPAVP